MRPKIRTLIVDDSAIIRQTLVEILESDSNIEVMATAGDPYDAVEKIQKEVPDVIILDIEMPKMDGLTFLRKIMRQHPIPVIIFSSLSIENSDATVRAMEYGAVDIIAKPQVNTKVFIEEARVRICDAIKAAAGANLKSISEIAEIHPTPKLNADAVIPKMQSSIRDIKLTEKIILIGASTGGTEAIRVVLQGMPVDCPGIVIVQHMPENFTASFAGRLNEICQINVKEAKDSDSVLRGQALIAPGNKHTLLKLNGARYSVEVKEGPLVNRHRPSVDVLFRSGARYAGKNAVAAILTGMGDDGAEGMFELHESGAYTIAQDESTCVVFGMPKEAIARGGVDEVLPLEKIASSLIKHSR